MRLRCFSDLHLDFDMKSGVGTPWVPKETEGDGDSVLVLAGDMWTGDRFFREEVGAGGVTWLDLVHDRFLAVVCVLGNHDCWDARLTDHHFRMREVIWEQGWGNVHLLQDDSVVIGDVEFAGGTLWTDFGGAAARPMVMGRAAAEMGDYLFMRGWDGKSVRPDEVFRNHRLTAAFLGGHKRDVSARALVFVTHHAPSRMSISKAYTGDAGNPHYYSALESLMDAAKPDVWIHGHTHSSSDYLVDRDGGGTRVICNPRGYAGRMENADFDEMGEVLV